MSNPTPAPRTRGIGFFGALSLLLLALKLTGWAAISWWWVLAPLAVPLFLGVCGLIIVLAAVASDNPRRLR